MGSAAIFIIALMTGGCVAMLIVAMFYNPDRTAVRSQIRDMYTEGDKDSFFSSLMKENQQKDGTGRKGIQVSQKFQREFETAGLNIQAGEFVLIWGACILFPLLICYMATGNEIMTAGVTAIGLAAPLLYFKKKQLDRREAFNRQFADVLLTICNSLKSGFPFQQAMGSVAERMQPPVSEEFQKALTEMDYGVSQHDAILHIFDRTKCEDVKMLVASLDISARVGGNLSDVLETISETVRTRIAIRQEVKTLSAQGKTSALIIGVLPILLIVVLSILNPDYIGQLLYTPTGQKMLIVAAIMETIGFTVMNRITDVKL